MFPTTKIHLLDLPEHFLLRFRVIPAVRKHAAGELNKKKDSDGAGEGPGLEK